MALRRPPDRLAALATEECSFDEVRPLLEEIYRRELPRAPETAGRFVEQHAVWDRILGTRRFAARIDGTLAGQCELYVNGADSQVEYVDTLEEYRGRGIARAVVLAAAEAAPERRSRSGIHRHRRRRRAEAPLRTLRVRPDRPRVGVHALPPAMR